jgi:ABC-type phosphate transport system substrate-binding protein
VTVAFFSNNIKAKGLPTRILRPITTARLPAISSSYSASKAITPAYRTAGSGTSSNFSGYLKATTSNFTESADWAVATGDATPRGNSYSKGSLLKAGVVATAGAIGYADLKDALSGVQIALLRNQAGQYYKADAARALTFLSQQTDIKSAGNVDINWAQSVSSGYNASLFTYAIVNINDKVKPNVGVSVNGANLKKFLGYVLSTCGPNVSKSLGYSQISGAVRTKALATINYIK